MEAAATADQTPAGDGAAPVRHVLVVDDDPGINRLVQARLTSRGFEVSSATNGEEALARIGEAPPDLIFLDVAMPGIGGLEVLQQVRAQGLDLAIIMMTAYGSEEVAIEALRRGADDYLRKPFEPIEFQAVLDRTVGRLTLSRQNTELRRQLDEKREQLEAELARAGQVQVGLLPREAPVLAGYDLTARCVPARVVGGDFYDWLQPSPGTLTLTLGDVMGKGMSAALLMATVRAVLRAAARAHGPAAALDLAARALEGDLERSERFVTLFHAQVDLDARRLTYVDAGHGHVFLRRADGRVEMLEPRGLPLGMFAGLTYQQGSVAVAPGDMLVVYSDGLIDARPDLALDPLILAGHLDGATSGQAVVDRLVELAALTGEAPDDLTVLALLCQG